MTRRSAPALAFALAVVAAFSSFSSIEKARASDHWIAGSDASVATNNDCGFVSAVHGQPVVVRSFHAEDAPGVPVNATDRVYTGDEIRVPDGGRLEITSGANVVAVFGEDSRVKFLGLRTFALPAGPEMNRLDLELLHGEARIQVRLNEARPESVLANAGGADFLIMRGDFSVMRNIAWQGSVLSGVALARLRRGDSLGAPFPLENDSLLGIDGAKGLTDEAKDRVRQRLPFSFETKRANCVFS